MNILAIDLGGKSAKVAIFDEIGKYEHYFTVTTVLDDVLNNLYKRIITYFKKNNVNYDLIKVVGFSTPGFLNHKSGIVELSGNLKWNNFNLKKNAENIFNKPVFVINDANAAILGEKWQGSGNKYNSLILYTIGTGIGGGIIINNELVIGNNGYAGEFGHGGQFQSSIGCTCGKKYCLEPLSSATGIERIAKKYIKYHPLSSLARLKRKLKSFPEVKEMKDLLLKDDKHTKKIFIKALKPLASHISTMLYALNPEAVIIGGGPSQIGKPLINLLKQLIDKVTGAPLTNTYSLEISCLENKVGMFGAAYWALINLNKIKKGN